MKTVKRRKFIYSAALLTGIPGILSAYSNAGITSLEKVVKGNGSPDGISVGVISRADNPEEDLKIVRDLGFPTCQLNIKNYSSGLAKRLSATLKEYKITPTTLICMGPGKYVYDFLDGPSTIGLIPREYRPERIARLREGIDFCKEVGIPAVHAHFGFIPEDPRDILYVEFVALMKDLGNYALSKGIDIYFETGQETPITLLRAITDIGTGNLFVNYDVANLVMYGKANPLDGLQILGKYVRSLHAKDGEYPTNPYKLGKEVPVPEGQVDFKGIVSTLKKIGFKGALTIEFELSGASKDYLLRTKKYLEDLIVSA
ncbi:MAG: sugar phosphate isomerase/epimerase family protein [Ginsengibacter sp.]